MLELRFSEDIKYFIGILKSLSFDSYLVGGAVRDLILGLTPLDYDFSAILTENEHYEAACYIQDTLKCKMNYNSYYHTAKFMWHENDIDFIMARKETYHEDCLKPTIYPSDICNDLCRRDFSINAISLSLNHENYLEIFDPTGGLQDISNHKIRILYSKSFEDDPTRIFRAIKYAARLDFDFDSVTEELIHKSIGNKVLNKLPQNRISSEILNLIKMNSFSTLKYLDRFNILSSVTNKQVYINTDMFYREFCTLSSDQRYAVLLHKNSKEVLEETCEFLGLSNKTINLCRAINNLTYRLEDNDIDFYTTLFSSVDFITDHMLKCIFYNTKRVQLFLENYERVSIDYECIVNALPKDRNNLLCEKKASKLLEIIAKEI